MTLVYVLLTFVVVTLLLLAIPIVISYDYDSRIPGRPRWHIVWLFGLVQIRPQSTTRKSAGDKPRQDVGAVRRARPRQSSAARQRRSGEVLASMLSTPGLLRHLLGLLYRLLTVARIQRCRAVICFGLVDPADTGRLYGLLSPVVACLSGMPRVEFSAMPLFNRHGFEAMLQARVHIIPINYVVVLLKFLVSRYSYYAAWAAIKARRS